MGTGTITRESRIEDILREYPETVGVFSRHGLYCAECIQMGFDCIIAEDTIEKRSDWYGINVDNLLADLNRLVEKEVSVD